MKAVLILTLLLLSPLVAQDENAVNTDEQKSIQTELLNSKLQVVSQSAEEVMTASAPQLNIELPVIYQPKTPQGIAYPMGDERTQTPKGKIYPSQTERDVVVGVLLTAAFQKILP